MFLEGRFWSPVPFSWLQIPADSKKNHAMSCHSSEFHREFPNISIANKKLNKTHIPNNLSGRNHDSSCPSKSPPIFQNSSPVRGKKFHPPGDSCVSPIWRSLWNITFEFTSTHLAPPKKGGAPVGHVSKKHKKNITSQRSQVQLFGSFNQVVGWILLNPD